MIAVAASIHPIRDFQTAQRYRGNPALYARLVRQLVADQKAGLTGRLALQEAYAAHRKTLTDKEPA